MSATMSYRNQTSKGLSNTGRLITFTCQLSSHRFPLPVYWYRGLPRSCNRLGQPGWFKSGQFSQILYVTSICLFCQTDLLTVSVDRAALLNDRSFTSPSTDSTSLSQVHYQNTIQHCCAADSYAGQHGCCLSTAQRCRSMVARTSDLLIAQIHLYAFVLQLLWLLPRLLPVPVCLRHYWLQMLPMNHVYGTVTRGHSHPTMRLID